MIKTKRWILAGCGLVLGLYAPLVLAETRYVDVNSVAPQSPFTNWGIAATNIQMAIDAAVMGDEVLVAPGRYLLTGSSVEIPMGKGIELKSAVSRAAIIDAQWQSPCLSVAGSNSVIEGFILCHGTNSGYGGGLILYRSCAIRDCLVISNRAWGAGGIMIDPGTSRVERCMIQGNLADWGGGVIFYNNSTSVMVDCDILDNKCEGELGYGGGVAFQGAGSLINCRVSGNKSVYGDAGGVHMDGGVLINTVISGNQADQYGGGVYHGGIGGGRIVNCTIVSNTAGVQGGGIMAHNSLSMWNSIIYFNASPLNANLYLAGSCTASNCCVTPSPSGSNFTNAPVFLDFAAWDLRIAAGSSCVDAGCTNYAPSFDYRGHARPADGNLDGFPRFDVGAYEYALDFKPTTAISNGYLNLRWDIINRGGYVVEVCSNLSFQTPIWTRLTGTNYYLGTNPSVTNFPIPLTGTNVIYRIRALHAPG